LVRPSPYMSGGPSESVACVDSVAVTGGRRGAAGSTGRDDDGRHEHAEDERDVASGTSAVEVEDPRQEARDAGEVPGCLVVREARA